MVRALFNVMKKIRLLFISLFLIFVTTSLTLSFAQAQTSRISSSSQRITSQSSSSPVSASQKVSSEKIKEILKKKRDARKLALKNKREKAKLLQANRKNNQQQKIISPVSQTKATATSTKPTYQPTKPAVPRVTELNTEPTSILKSSSDDSIVKVSADVSLSYEQQAEASDDGSQAKGVGLTVVPKVKIGDFSLSTTVTYAYNTVDPEQSELADGLISAGYTGWHLLPSLKLAPSLSVELPFSKESRENRGIIYVANAGLRLSLDTKYLGIEKYALSYAVSYGHFSNEFTTRENGDPAVKYKIVQTVATSYNFDPISVGLKLQFGSNYSYEDVVRNGFLHVEYISFQHTDTVGYSLYHYNAGPLFKGTNYQNNLKAYDKDSSTVGVSLDLSI